MYQENWAIIDFISNVQGPPGISYGKMAAEAVREEIVKRRIFTTIPASVINRALADLSLRLPLTAESQLVRLAKETNSTLVVAGTVIEASIQTKGGEKRAMAHLRILVHDGVTGTIVNGAVVRAYSSPAPPNTSDAVLIGEAIRQAAFEGTTIIVERRQLIATVQNTIRDEAFITMGIRGGYTKGQKVIVYRPQGSNNELVCLARVVRASSYNAVIKITELVNGIAPEDLVRPIVPVFDSDKESIGGKKRGGILAEIGQFFAQLFGISP